MEDDLDLVDHAPARVQIPQIRNNDLYIPGDGVEIGEIAGRQVIHHSHSKPTPQELVHKMRPDEPRPARHQTRY